MRILFIRNTNAISGAETASLYLIKELRKFHDSEIYYMTDFQPLTEKLKNLGVEAKLLGVSIPEVGTKKTLIKTFLLLPKLLFSYFRLISSFVNIDIIVLQGATEKFFLTPFFKLKKYKIIWLEQGPQFCTDRSQLIKKVYAFSSKFADKIICVSEDTKDDFVKGKIDNNKLYVIPNGIPIKNQELRIRNQGKSQNRKFVIGYSGKINKEKGIIEFIEVANLVLKKNRKVLFLLVGDGPMFGWAKKRVKDLGIEEHFRFTGFQDDVRKYLRMMDIFFFPTNHYEGLSLALLEAAVMELLIVAHHKGGNREIVINENTGFLYREYDKEEVAEKLLHIMKHYKVYDHMRKSARRLVKEKYDIKITAKMFYEFIRLINL